MNVNTVIRLSSACILNSATDTIVIKSVSGEKKEEILIILLISLNDLNII